MSVHDEKNPDYVARGLKAAIHNPNVSQEAKAHAAKQLKEMGLSGDDVQQQMSEDEHRRHQLAGYKAALTNEHTSPEAKKHAQSVLDRVASEESKHEHRVMAGYKAALKNPRTSEEAKQQAERVLKNHDAL